MWCVSLFDVQCISIRYYDISIKYEVYLYSMLSVSRFDIMSSLLNMKCISIRYYVYLYAILWVSNIDSILCVAVCCSVLQRAAVCCSVLYTCMHKCCMYTYCRLDSILCAFTFVRLYHVWRCLVLKVLCCCSVCCSVCCSMCCSEYSRVHVYHVWYGVASSSRLLKILCLFCRIWSLL